MKSLVMMAGGLAAALLLAVTAPAFAAPVQRDQQLALFQPRTIFHSGLVQSHMVALTFDDGPNANTQGVLDELKKLHVKATFFIVGKMAHRNPTILARIAAEGHLLANHSADHALLGADYDANPEKLLGELRYVDDQIEPLMHPGDKLFFRAPFGSWKTAHAAILNRDAVLRNYIGPIYWDVGGDVSMTSDGYVLSAADWKCWSLHWTPQVCAKGYLREIRRKNGGVVLIHCIQKQSAALVAAVVPALIEEGYTFVRLDQMPAYRQYETPGSGTDVALGAPPALPPGRMIPVSNIRTVK